LVKLNGFEIVLSSLKDNKNKVNHECVTITMISYLFKNENHIWFLI